jgi:hypothetical protein
MEDNRQMIFQVDSNEVAEARKLDNFLIIETDCTGNENIQYCAVYFSSNFIYYPNNKESLNESIFVKNKFEWYNLRHPKAKKHIFLRDVYKQWYLHGINNKIDSIEKLIDFIHGEIKGYKCFFIGSSAGGYAATIIGSRLAAEFIYNFNGQFILTDLLENSTSQINPIIFRERNNPNISKYYDIRHLIDKPKKIYYFHSNKSNWDLLQYDTVSDLQINVISMNTRFHGIPILKNNLSTILGWDSKALQAITIKRQNPILLSIKIVGIKATTEYLFKELISKIKYRFF